VLHVVFAHVVFVVIVVVGKTCRYGLGFGLSYDAKFQYSVLSATKGANGSVNVGVTVTNTGTRAARTVVQVRNTLLCQRRVCG
jgi:hypothetical protein